MGAHHHPSGAHTTLCARGLSLCQFCILYVSMMAGVC